MATIEEVKSELMQAAGSGGQAITQARAASESMDRMIAQLQVVAHGTNHPKVAEAVARAQQCQQQLAQAVILAQAATQAAHDYVAVLG
ncbi:hypothetical protein GCM10023322_23030 [Rugosimonospora acidiphila]|uniref:Uncharacterized protein n=1 Tax=Rugosimonospora acidiphila TaxID=556531 RepID=A0ABP9RQU5_9ACTN